MKKAIIYIATALCLMTGIAGCSDFGDTNIDPERLTGDKLDYKLMFTNVQTYVYGTDWEVWRNSMIYISTMLQHTASTESYWNGDKYTYNMGYNAAYWDRIFPNGIRNAIDVINHWKDDDAYKAEVQMMRIMKVILFHRMTDQYGDIPYSEAGLGFIEGIGYPKYDDQQSIYMDMLKELKEAAETLSTLSGSQIATADLMYGGDIAKWRKFAYSLMLRLGMRLSKVDPSTAQTWVNTAITGGLFESNSDNGIIEHPDGEETNGSIDGFAKIIVHEDPSAYRLSESFINLLKNSNDPRLPLIATVCEEPSHKIGSGRWQLGDTTFSKQLGMPNGYDTNNEDTDISKAPNWTGNKNDYSVICRYTFSKRDAPTFVLTYAENQLLLAEAAHRGWISGSAKEYYDRGVKAAMQQFSQFGITGIPDSRIDQYLTENAFDATKALEQINTQYYIVTFSDEYETFANWRRSGYPVLKTVNYYNNVTNGTIPRRFTYPNNESARNETNYNTAVAKLKNGDAMTSRVWWDAE